MKLWKSTFILYTDYDPRSEELHYLATSIHTDLGGGVASEGVFEQVELVDVPDKFVQEYFQSDYYKDMYPED